MKLRLWGFCFLLNKYILIVKESWAIRKSMSAPARRSEEYDFLPAHIELIERPVSPLPRFISCFIIMFLVISLFISVFFHVEVVAVSPGKLELSGHSKLIQPLETSLIKKIYVKDGQLVKKGQLLISLSATGIESDKAKSESAMIQAKLAEQRQMALLKAIDINSMPIHPDVHFLNDSVGHNELIYRSKRLLHDQFIAWRTGREQQESVIWQRESERDVINAQLRKLNKQKRITSEKLKDIRKLFAKGAISKHELLDQENLYIDITNELDAQYNKLKEINALIMHARDEHKLLLQNFKRDTLEQLNQTKESIIQLGYELERVQERKSALQITSPVDGTVQQVMTYTEGGVVTTAQTLMVIVPHGEQLDAKVMISNKDIGFIRPGQKVVIKVDAFPYTRYGYVYGTVKTVSAEAIEDKERGIYFDGTITLDKSMIKVYGKNVVLASGMSISAEIITGYRRVIDFILSPLQEVASESLKER